MAPRPPGKGELGFYAFSRDVSVGASRIYLPGRVLGREHIPRKGPFILAPVHRSYVDWLLAARVTRRRMRFMVKEEVWQSRFAGRLLEALGAFPVKRSGADREALERCRAVLGVGEPLVMFPEGTRRSGPVVEELREGVAYLALQAGVPIIPVGIGGSEAAMPRGASLPKPHRVDVVVGAALWPRALQPRQSPGPPGDDLPGRRRRVSRVEMRDLSEELRSAMQATFDAARSSAGVP